MTSSLGSVVPGVVLSKVPFGRFVMTSALVGGAYLVTATLALKLASIVSPVFT